MQQLLDKAIELAEKYHQGQFDKGGTPYIEHPLRVMARLDTIEEKIVGVLHDIVEDTVITFEDLYKMGFPDYIVLAIDAVTRREGEKREAFIFRCSQNVIGTKVKVADLKENCDLNRIPNPIEKDFKRVVMYKREIKILTEENWNFKNKKWRKVR